jgi:methylated-DNA-protein-cysteine methyltransferase related protein
VKEKLIPVQQVVGGFPKGTNMRSTLALLREVIARVPRGKVITYGEVAEAAGFPGGARLTVWGLQGGEGLPWHRVVGAGGRIALRGSQGQEQRLRLEMEGVKFRGGRVRMDLHRWTPRIGQGSRARRSDRTSRTPPKNLANGRAVAGRRRPFTSEP